MDALRTLRQQADVLALHHLLEIDLDVRPAAPADRDPGVGRHEMIAAALADHGQRVAFAQLRRQFIGHQCAAQSGTENHHFRHRVHSLDLLPGHPSRHSADPPDALMA